VVGVGGGGGILAWLGCLCAVAKDPDQEAEDAVIAPMSSIRSETPKAQAVGGRGGGGFFVVVHVATVWRLRPRGFLER
jgi:hypothetical protein